MGLFGRVAGIFAREAIPTAPPKQIQMLPQGTHWIDVVGESFFMDSFAKVLGTAPARRVDADVVCALLPEPGNPYDPNAVGVWVDGNQVGHLAREDASYLAPLLRSWLVRDPNVIWATQGHISGPGWNRCGVYLQLDLAQFGAPVLAPAVRTGMSTAPAGSVGWFETLSEDRITRIKQLRKLLTTETDPVSRHFLFSVLEEVLYRVREEMVDALTEFDQVTEAHHHELITTRCVLLQQFGGMPLLETYRQASIRRGLAGDLQGSLEWALRGIDMYGQDALRAEWRDDLEHRASRARERMAAAEVKHDRSKPEPRPVSTRTMPVATPSQGGVVETLICQTCGEPFERPGVPGRKPLRCPECVSESR